MVTSQVWESVQAGTRQSLPLYMQGRKSLACPASAQALCCCCAGSAGAAGYAEAEAVSSALNCTQPLLDGFVIPDQRFVSKIMRLHVQSVLDVSCCSQGLLLSSLHLIPLLAKLAIHVL